MGEAGVLALWNDCASTGEAEYERWYMAQHLPERIGVPGFRFGRRYVRLQGDRKYFTFYETDSPDVLWSPAYLERLANPTDWTQKVMLDFQNTIRTACRKAGADGNALGGHAVTYRAMSGKAAATEIEAVFHNELLPDLLGREGVCHAHLWIAAEEQTPSKTAETDLRGEDELVSWAVIVETTFEEAATQVSADSNLAERIGAVDRNATLDLGVYRLVCILSPDMLPNT